MSTVGKARACTLCFARFEFPDTNGVIDWYVSVNFSGILQLFVRITRILQLNAGLSNFELDTPNIQNCLLTNKTVWSSQRPSVCWHCRLGHLTCKDVRKWPTVWLYLLLHFVRAFTISRPTRCCIRYLSDGLACLLNVVNLVHICSFLSAVTRPYNVLLLSIVQLFRAVLRIVSMEPWPQASYQ